MKKIALVAAVLASAAIAQAGQILVGTQNDGNGDIFVGNQGNLENSSDVGVVTHYANIGWAQAFDLSSAAIANDVSVWVAYNNVPSTFNLQLTDKIGAGATSSDVLFSGSGTFGSSHSWVDFKLGDLALNSGTYYLVMTSSTPVPEIALDGSNCGGLPATDTQAGCFLTGEWGVNGTQVSTQGSIGNLYIDIAFGGGANGSAPALTDFDPAGSPNGSVAEFQLNGTLASTAAPEPSTLALFAPAALLFALFARRRRTA